MNCNANANFSVPNKLSSRLTKIAIFFGLKAHWTMWLYLELGLFGMLKLALALQFIVTNAYFSVACNTKVSVRATPK